MTSSTTDKRVNKVRSPTKAKTQVNNYFRMQPFCTKDIVSWMRVFREELVDTNCGKSVVRTPTRTA